MTGGRGDAHYLLEIPPGRSVNTKHNILLALGQMHDESLVAYLVHL